MNYSIEIESCLPTLLTRIINEYLFDSNQQANNTVCLVWDNFDYNPDFSISGQFVILRPPLFLHDSLEQTFCERFVVLGNIILPFLDAFVITVMEVLWRSSENKIVLTADEFDDEILSHRIVKEIPDILFLKIQNLCLIEAYTSRFKSLYSPFPEELYLLDVFDESGFQRNANLFPYKKDNFYGREIRLGEFSYPPFNYFSPNSENGNSWVNESGKMVKYFLEGVESNILVNYCARYNCTIEIVPSEYGEWGSIYENYSGDGLLGMIPMKRADIILNSMYQWQNIYATCGITRTMSRSGITFLIPRPKIVGSYLLPIYPFSKTLWMGVLLCSLLEVVSIAYVHYRDLPQSSNHKILKSLSFGTMSSYQIFCSQSVNDDLIQTPKRIIFFSCFIIDLIITSAYGGGLATILTLPSFGEVADTLEKMVDFELEWGGITYDWLYSVEFSEDTTIINLLKRFHVYSAEKMANLSAKGEIGVILERLTFGLFSIPEFFTNDAAKHYTVSKEEMYFELCVAYVSKSWAHMENYNKFISMVEESGLPEIWEWQMGVKYIDDTILNTLMSSKHLGNIGEDEPVPLGMSNFSGMIIIWCIGIGVSTLVFCYEVTFGRKAM